jgi:Porin subfamily
MGVTGWSASLRRIVRVGIVAGGIVGISEARAADLPLRAAGPAEGVKQCNVAGMAGFILPGSDTCFKISGYVAAQLLAGNLTKQYGLVFTGVPGESPVTSQELTPVSARDWLGFTTRAQVNVDVRELTSYGVLRGYAEMLFTNGSGFEAPINGSILNLAYVQFAGLTAGKAPSFFSYLAGGETWYDFYSPDRVTSNQPDVLAYTATFGNGFSTTISLEDQTGANVNNPINGGFNNTYSGMIYPDVVAVLRLDQSWGSAQLSGVAHNTRAIGVSGDTINLWGYAALAGATVNLPWVGPGDRVAAQGVFSRAALGYSGIPNTPLSLFDQGFNLNGNGTIFQLTDALNYNFFSWSTPAAWSAAAFFEHHFSPEFSVAPEASFASVRYSQSPVMISDNATSFLGGIIAHWDPVPHLDFQFSLMYQATRQATPSSYVGPAPFHPDNSGVAGSLQIVRDY